MNNSVFYIFVRSYFSNGKYENGENYELLAENVYFKNNNNNISKFISMILIIKSGEEIFKFK